MATNLKKDSNVETSADSVGGSRILPSAIYLMDIQIAYLGESRGGAASLNLHLKDAKGRELQATIYISTSKAKGQSIYYTGKDKKEHFLPGFELATSLTELVLGQEIGDIPTEEKYVAIYDYNAGKDKDTKVDMLTPLIGKTIAVAVIECRDNKSAIGESGKYEDDPSGKDRRYNEISKFFNNDGLTIQEVNANATAPGFIITWKEAFEGKKRDRYKTVANAGAVSGAPANTPTTGNPFG